MCHLLTLAPFFALSDSPSHSPSLLIYSLLLKLYCVHIFLLIYCLLTPVRKRDMRKEA